MISIPQKKLKRYKACFEQQAITDQAPQTFFHGSQIACQAQQVRAIHCGEGRKEMAPMATKTVEQSLVLGESQIGA